MLLGSLQPLLRGLILSVLGAFLLFRVGGAPAYADDSSQGEACSHFLTYANSQARVWDTVTARTAVSVLSRLTLANGRSLQGIKGKLPPFSHKAVLIGQRSLLSLGEGLSRFVSNYLDFDPSLSVHAVDMIYADSEQFAAKLGEATIHFQVQQLHQKYPGHYHAQYYQSLNVHELKFDEVVSSHSLAYILNPAKFDQDLDLLRTVVQSLKPGGVLRFWPLRRDAFEHVKTLAERLMTEGWLRNHNRVRRGRGPMDEPDADAVAIFQRK